MAVALVAVAFAGGDSAHWHTFRQGGVSYRYPPSWHATAHRLTPVTWPAQIIAAASYPLPSDDRDADGCLPTELLRRLTPTGAFIFGWEYTRPIPTEIRRHPRGFPPRPKHFKLIDYSVYECTGPGYRLRFREGGRLFQIHVVLGSKPTAATRATVLRILDSFTVH
jgi:hypothetical protein